EEALLTKTGILVPDREEEKKEMSCMLDKLNERHPVLNLSVIINLDCNFSCVYCYEADLKGKSYMSEETADRLIDFIKDKFAHGKSTINLDFYGGEPLLSRELIKYISRSLKSFTESRGGAYTFTLVTNGSLLKRDAVQELVDLGLIFVKTTIDGPAEAHNKCRPFKSGTGSFDTIINNIKQTCDIVKTGIGGNYTKGNYIEFPTLLDFLKEEGLTPEKVYTIKFAPVITRPKDDISPADYHDGCLSVNEPWLLEADSLLREEVLKRGFNTPKIIPSPCQVEVRDYYVVNYDGTLYKCPALIGKKRFEIGSLKEGVKDETAI
ncbi:MAG: geopeptide radical SAM maturase, partial [Nitrospirae bacterium]|nr:geopeptide radical SAM maturase [Nitrospirota bacterium]